MTIGIGELARRTGLTQQVVRVWESRFGFPAPERTEGGRRQYAEADVDRVQRVLALKDSGVRLAQAVDRVRAEETSGTAVGLRRPPRAPPAGRVAGAAPRRARRHLPGHRGRGDVAGLAARRLRRVPAGVVLPPRLPALGRDREDRRVLRGLRRLRRTRPPARARRSRSRSPRTRPCCGSGPWSWWRRRCRWPWPGGRSRGGRVAPRGDRAFESIFTFDPAAVRTAAQVCLGVARAAGTVPDPGSRR